jgi:hypothetical protein
LSPVCAEVAFWEERAPARPLSSSFPHPPTTSAEIRRNASEKNEISSFILFFIYRPRMEERTSPNAAHYTILWLDCKAQMQKK